MQLSSNNLFFLSLLFGACSAAPAPQQEFISNLPILTVPVPGGLPITAPQCFKSQSCYTATTTVTPAKCPKTRCPVPTNPIACPAVVRITTTQVPCANACCPSTPTKTATAKCPGCTTGCVIPTITETITTGCETGKPPVLTLFPAVKRGGDVLADPVASLPVIRPTAAAHL
ncbi:hypothetical protein QBC42DRAFT_296140 [Cladorrhinum samala]|uniref:Uncharacterized protein n=1 Tax=Cladorrhinum samala TaxID=585594 RepID=A0AAV9HTQ3_9PEZI|nr:hypothetical protein QBC42DRAFT_296140 [Cladorrhinum samala]